MAPKIEPPVRFGVLSFAMYHANFWVRAVQESDLAELVGVWDDEPKRGEVSAQAMTGYSVAMAMTAYTVKKAMTA